MAKKKRRQGGKGKPLTPESARELVRRRQELEGRPDVAGPGTVARESTASAQPGASAARVVPPIEDSVDQFELDLQPARSSSSGRSESRRTENSSASWPGETFEAFARSLVWLDGSPLWDQIEDYRREIFRRALDTWEPDGRGGKRRTYSLVLAGRGKKNAKTLDLALAALRVLLGEPGPRGLQCYLFASDEDQAGDDLDLVKKLIQANPRTLGRRLLVRKKAVLRRDGAGALEILPGQDVAGSHGKSYAFVGFDEVHTMRTWALLEAMQPDPNRPEALTWLTSYASIHHRPGVPLFDLMAAGKKGTDPRMLFSWYAADFTTDPAFAGLEPEARANPSMASWSPGYLAQQQLRVPAHVFRRLHLNLPGLPEGSAFTAEMVMDAVARGVFARPPVDGVRYLAFVDHSHGSSDDAGLAIGHAEGEQLVLDVCTAQGGSPPFSMFDVIPRFAARCRDYRIAAVTGDAVGGETYREAWRREGIEYRIASRTTSELYEALEPLLNTRRCVLVDVPLLEQELLGLVWKGARITHNAGEHDDLATSAAGCLTLLSGLGAGFDPIAWPGRSFSDRRAQPGRVVDAAGTRYVGDGTFVTRDGERYRDPRYS